MNQNVVRRSVALMASAALLASVTVATIATPAVAQPCTYKMTEEPGYDPTGQTVNVYSANIGGSQVVCGGDGADKVKGRIWPGGTFIGGPGDDTVEHSLMDGTFIGGPGDDTVTGTVYGSWAPAVFDGGPGNDRVLGSLRTDPGSATFIGGGGADSVGQMVYASSGSSATFDGGAGNDSARYVYAYNGSATFDGGAGNDSARYVYAYNGSATFDGGAGSDAVSDYIYAYGGGTATFNGDGDGAGGTVSASVAGDDTVGGSVGTSWAPRGAFTGGPGNDTVGFAPPYGGWRYCSVHGTFNGGDGNDKVACDVNGEYGGAATFIGGAGNDTIGSNLAWDATFEGRGDNDTVKGSIAGATFNGGLGADTVELHVGWADYAGASGAGVFNGGAGADKVLGEVRYESRFNGNGGDDWLTRLTSGTFDGGADFDIAKYHDGGTCIDVEVCGKQAQTISFDLPDEGTYGDPALVLGGTASSGFKVQYAVVSGPCTIVGADENKLRFDARGTCEVKAKQPGNAYYLPAAAVTDSIIVRKADLTATCDDKERINLMPNPSLTMSYSGFVHGEDKSILDTKPWCETAATKTSPAGDHAITCENGSDTNYAITCVHGTLTITYVAPITYQGQQDFSGDTTIRIGDKVKGHVTASDGVFKVEGTVNGNVTQTGPGDVIVNGGHINGGVAESGVGDVKVFDGSVVNGGATEQGGGSVIVSGGSRVTGGIHEHFDGGVLVGGAGTLVNGGIDEAGNGDVVVRNEALVKGNVCEQDAGEVTAESGGRIGKDKEC